MSQGSPPQDNKEPSPEPDSHKEEATTNTAATAADAAPPAPTRNRPSRACTIRTAARLYTASQPARPKAAKRRLAARSRRRRRLRSHSNAARS
ncbi:hypothetical protein ACSQ67_019632 [Phaseolus vulgaris]